MGFRSMIMHKLCHPTIAPCYTKKGLVTNMTHEDNPPLVPSHTFKRSLFPSVRSVSCPHLRREPQHSWVGEKSSKLAPGIYHGVLNVLEEGIAPKSVAKLCYGAQRERSAQEFQ